MLYTVMANGAGLIAFATLANVQSAELRRRTTEASV